jgi:hypothetical protein
VPRLASAQEQEQRGELVRLGLGEVEAVAYVLMLSRDEEEMRRRLAVVDGGELSRSSTNAEERYVTDGGWGSGSVVGPSVPPQDVRVLASPSSDALHSSKVQLVPRAILEPMEAGGILASSPAPAPAPGATAPQCVLSAADFPPIRPASLVRSDDSLVEGSPGSSPSSFSTSSSSSSWSGWAARGSWNSVAAAGMQYERERQVRKREEEELRLAVELSLADARRREEGVELRTA